ncbi:MAG: hypothetical protein PHG61_03650 [Candidatus Marinimicrobia bacterium]|nr:hypothetical protein [Candidatus Neomarinimicrobiota bacterium]
MQTAGIHLGRPACKTDKTEEVHVSGQRHAGQVSSEQQDGMGMGEENPVNEIRDSGTACSDDRIVFRVSYGQR